MRRRQPLPAQLLGELWTSAGPLFPGLSRNLSFGSRASFGRLRQIGKEITERLAKADKQTQLARDHLIAIEQLLKEANELCDGGGFKKFRELFCPQLGKSQAYALLAIAAGKKTFAEHRANERERKRGAPPARCRLSLDRSDQRGLRRPHFAVRRDPDFVGPKRPYLSAMTQTVPGLSEHRTILPRALHRILVRRIPVCILVHQPGPGKEFHFCSSRVHASCQNREDRSPDICYFLRRVAHEI